MPNTGKRGKVTYYPGKLTDPKTQTFTQDATDALGFMKTATHASRGDLVEHAVRKLVGLPVNPDLDTQVTGALAQFDQLSAVAHG